MPSTATEKANCEVLKRAVRNGHIALMVCHDRATKERIPTLCAMHVPESAPEGTELEVEFIPIAKLFTQDPYKELLPPTEEEKDAPK